MANIFSAAWQKSADFKQLASKEQAQRWDNAPHELLSSPDLSKKVLGILFRLTITPEIIQARARNYLEDSGVIKEINEPIGAYKQHILMSLPKATDPKFLDLENLTSVDQQKIWLTEDKEYFQDLQNLATTIPLTISRVDYRRAFATTANMEDLLSAKRNGQITAYKLNMLYAEMDAIDKAINSTEFPKTNQTITMENDISDIENMSADAYRELLRIVRGIKYSMTHNFTGKYNSAKFPTMTSEEDLIMLVRAPIEKNVGVNLLFSAFNKEDLGFDIETIPVPHFGGLKGFTPAYNAEGQQTVSIDDMGELEDPNEDVMAIITTKRYFVKNTVVPFSVEPAPYNARGLYLSLYGNYLGGITGIDYEPFIIIKKKPATP